MAIEPEPPSMTEGRGLLTEAEREAIAGERSDSYRYKTRAYLRSRLEEVERDVQILAEHAPDLLEDLQETVCDVDSDPLSDVEFPASKERSECIDTVLAARSFLEDNGPASQSEIVAGVMPDHPLGYDVDKAIEKVTTSGERYRGSWWRRIVKPGLEALSDVEKPTSGAAEWEYLGGD